MSGAVGAEPVDQRHDQQAAEAERRDPEELDHAEDAREDLVRDGALDEGERGDVHERVARADDREEHDRDRGLGPEPDRDERQSPEHDPADERRAQSAHPCERESRERPISAPTPMDEFRYPTPDSPMSRSSKAMTTMRTVSAPATRVWAEKRPSRMRSRASPPTVRNPTRASARMPERLAAFGALRLGGNLDAGDDERREGEERCREEEDELGARSREQQPGERRADEVADALERARDGVRRRELRGRAGNRGRDRSEGGTERGADEHREADDRVHGHRAARRGRRTAPAPAMSAARSEVGRDHHRDAAVAVGEHRGERRDERQPAPCG